MIETSYIVQANYSINSLLAGYKLNRPNRHINMWILSWKIKFRGDLNCTLKQEFNHASF